MSKRKCSVLDYACYREWRLIVNDIIPPIKTEILRLTQSLEYTITISKKVVKLLHIRIKSCAVHQLFQPVIGHFTQRYVWLWWQLIIIKAVNKIKQAHKTSVLYGNFLGGKGTSIEAVNEGNKLWHSEVCSGRGKRGHRRRKLLPPTLSYPLLHSARPPRGGDLASGACARWGTWRSSSAWLQCNKFTWPFTVGHVCHHVLGVPVAAGSLFVNLTTH